MIRLALVLPLLLLASCMTPAAPALAPAPAPSAEVPNDKCHGDRVQDLIGQPRSDGLGEKARQRAGAGVIRWIPMGAMVTMDYRFDRLNLRLGPDGKVTAINCG